MKKIYFLLALVSTMVMQAKAGDVANFTFKVNSATGTVVFTNTSTLDGQLERKAWWSFGDGSSLRTPALYGAEHHYAHPGTYTVCLKIYSYASATDSTLRNSSCQTVTIENVCGARFEFKDQVSDNPFAHNVTFAAIPMNNGDKKITKVCWNFGDGSTQCIEASAATSTATLMTIKHTYPQTSTPLATYNVCVTITYDGGCEGKDCHILYLQSPVVSNCPADFSVTATSIPNSKSFTFISTDSKKPLKVCWKFGDGSSSCETYGATYTGTYTVNHTFLHGGNFEVCAAALYDGGCESRKCKVVNVPPPPMPTLCKGDFKTENSSANTSEIFFSPVFENNNLKPVQVCWKFRDGSPDLCKTYGGDFTGTYSVSHKYEHGGNYEVCMYIKYDGGCEAKKCKLVSVAGATVTPTCQTSIGAAFLGNKTFVFHGYIAPATTATGATYNWNFGDGTTGTGAEIRHTFAAAGSYQVCVESKTTAGCESHICKTLIVENAPESKVTLSPNPVVSVLHATFFSTKTETVSIRIFNANGVVVKTFTKSVIAGSNTWEFDLSNLPIGVYSIIIQSPGQFATAIFFKQ